MSNPAGVKFVTDRSKPTALPEEKLSAAARPNALIDHDERTLPKNIFEAAERGLAGWIVKTVERSVEFDINQRDRLSRTAIQWAAEMGHVNVIETLIDYGADVKLADCNGRSAMHHAARACQVEAMEALLEGLSPQEVDDLVNGTDAWGVTPVFLALQKHRDGQAAFEFLMKHGARYNTTSSRLHAHLDAPESDGNPPAERKVAAT